MFNISNRFLIINYLFSFLIDTSSGQVIGIDFGSAFNAATIVRSNLKNLKQCRFIF
jgi:hypothetical protein